MTDGYDSGFLATPVPLPRSPRGTHVLDYPRFTVLLDLERHLAAVTGVNIDGAALQDLPRSGEWRLDDRIGADEQVDPAVYADNDLDRGHLVRRRDPGWGDAAEAQAAMRATFFYPNAAPQAAGFNQSKQLWLGLEDHVLSFAEATDQRISVFTAPVLAGDDPPYRGVRVPLRFWKIAAWQTDAGLATAGFILDQGDLVDTRNGRLTTPPLGEFRTFQVPVAEISRLTGLDLSRMPEADVLPSRDVHRAAWRELEAQGDIVL